MAVLRPGYTRLAVRVQYHGGSFLGFAKQKDENCIVTSSDGKITDLRGYVSVQSRLEQALQQLCPNFETIQVSSRTDRGVHALGNTFHVDIPQGTLTASQLHHGINYYLMRSTTDAKSYDTDNNNNNNNNNNKRRRLKNASLHLQGGEWVRAGQDIRILAAREAPRFMPSRDAVVDWNARFSARSRIYAYRILCSHDDHDWAIPFEWDRSWILKSKKLDVTAMRQASQHLVGERDFSSFRASGCQRSSPIVRMQEIQIHEQSYGPVLWNSPQTSPGGGGGLLDLGYNANFGAGQLVTLRFVGDAFLYRQVRNMTGCLVEVGRGRLLPNDVIEILAQRDRTVAPSMAPPGGLFLVHVQHGDFVF